MTTFETPAAPEELAHLVQHREAVDANKSVADIYDFFQSHKDDFAAVVDANRVIGICGRSQILGQLAGRYGFALHSRSPVREHLLPGALLVHNATPLRELLERALVRDGDAFYEDVVVVGDDGELIGLVSTRRLVQAQSELLRSQFNLLEEQQRHLKASNNDLARSLEQQRILERHVVAQEKAALVETLASGIAHELNNKLMPIVGHAELLIEEVAPFQRPTIEESSRTIFSAAIDASHIIKQLSQLSRPSPSERTTCDLRELVKQSLVLVGLRLKEANVHINVELPEEPVAIHVDGGQIRQVGTNLLLNAIDAMDKSSRRALDVRVTTTAEHAVVTVSDTGVGMAPDMLTKIFDPFFTTKAPNRGTGLGLSVSQSIMRANSGEITVLSSVDVGTTFGLRFARASHDVGNPAGVPKTGREAQYGHVRILVVEDDDAVAGVVARALTTKLGCDVLRAENGEAACAHLAEKSYDLVLSDVRMPGMNGIDLLSWIDTHRPSLSGRFVFMTGDVSDSPINAAVYRAGLPVLRKPLTIDGVANGIRAVLDSALNAGIRQVDPLST